MRNDDMRRAGSYDRLERAPRSTMSYSSRETRHGGHGGGVGRVDSVGGSDVYDYVDSRRRRGGSRHPNDHYEREYHSMPRSKSTVMYPKGEFLREVQEELESRRAEWKDEVERMIEGLTIKNMNDNVMKKNGTVYTDILNGGSTGYAPNSYVDTSTGAPIFKALVDVSDYPLNSISLNVDKLENKLVVTAKKPDIPGMPSNTFKQKVALPRFADDQRIKTKLNKKGILTIEVPLMYYFEPEKKKAKSFINQIKRNKDGTKSVEILVNIGHDVKPWEVKVGVNKEGEIVIRTEKETMLSNGDTTKTRQLIKRYILPEGADVQHITSNMGKDGRLSVNVPIIRGSVSDLM